MRHPHARLTAVKFSFRKRALPAGDIQTWFIDVALDAAPPPNPPGFAAMLKASLAAAMLLACAPPALADAVTYQGTIGKIPVVVEFSAEIESAEGEIFGRYFYPRKGIDIPLDAVEHSAGKLIVRE